MVPHRRPTAFISTLRSLLQKHIRAVVNLHYRTAQQPLPKLPAELNITLILQIVSECCSTFKIAYVVGHAVMTLSNRRMTALRVTMMYALKNTAGAWPVVEWQEEDGTEVIAIFHFDDLEDPSTCSWLKHVGRRYSLAERRWMENSIAWNVATLAHLKTLFIAAQHTLGVLEWSVADAIALYCQSSPKECSKDEYASHLALLIHGG
jgi:hypothetical protein